MRQFRMRPVSLLAVVILIGSLAALRHGLPTAAAQAKSPDQGFTVAGVPIRLPTVLPAGYRFYVSARRGHAAVPDMDVLVLSYRSDAGEHLHITAGWPVPYDDEGYQSAPAEEKGTATVEGQPALWVRSRVPLPGPPLDAASATPLSLRWRSGEQTPEGEPVGYAVQADALPLEDLLAVAASLQPYPLAIAAGGPPRATPVMPDPLVPAALWSITPTLGDVPGERFLGRIVVEAGIGSVFTPSESQSLAARAADALEREATFPAVGPPWPEVSMMRPDASPEEFRGRVIIELWEQSALIAITPTTLPVADLVAEAVRTLHSVRP